MAATLHGTQRRDWEATMTALRNEAFFDRLPDAIEIKNAKQLRTLVAAQIKADEPTTLSLALEGGEIQTVTLMPALVASLLEVLRFISSSRGFRVDNAASRRSAERVAPLFGKAPRAWCDSIHQDRTAPACSRGGSLRLQGKARRRAL